MFLLIAIAALVILGIYYVTTIDFEVGSGITEAKRKAKDAEFTEAEVRNRPEEQLEGEKKE